MQWQTLASVVLSLAFDTSNGSLPLRRIKSDVDNLNPDLRLELAHRKLQLVKAALLLFCLQRVRVPI